jgi:hypothetical protein
VVPTSPSESTTSIRYLPSGRTPIDDAPSKVKGPPGVVDDRCVDAPLCASVPGVDAGHRDDPASVETYAVVPSGVIARRSPKFGPSVRTHTASGASTVRGRRATACGARRRQPRNAADTTGALGSPSADDLQVAVFGSAPATTARDESAGLIAISSRPSSPNGVGTSRQRRFQREVNSSFRFPSSRRGRDLADGIDVEPALAAREHRFPSLEITRPSRSMVAPGC